MAPITSKRGSRNDSSRMSGVMIRVSMSTCRESVCCKVCYYTDGNHPLKQHACKPLGSCLEHPIVVMKDTQNADYAAQILVTRLCEIIIEHK